MPFPDRARLEHFALRIALVDGDEAWTYAQLLAYTRILADGFCSQGRLEGERIAYLFPPGRVHVAVQWSIWDAGGIAVPLAVSHPLRELVYILDDAQPRILVVDSSLNGARELIGAAKARKINVQEVPASHSRRPEIGVPGPTFRPDGGDPEVGVAGNDGVDVRGKTSPGRARRRVGWKEKRGDGALIIYTSGTTGRPKGVLTTHGSVAAQIQSLVRAWNWSKADRILHVLPLHHIHGIVNALFCALWSGAICEFGSPHPRAIWERLASGEITLFMAVPAMYSRLIHAWEAASSATQRRWARGAGKLRLAVSGSAALPVRTLERWRDITGHTLLERYGMTEIGMALSNPVVGERRTGHVGQPLPGVELRIVNDEGHPVDEGSQGEIEVRGPQLFREYWGRPEETRAAFRNGWFRTGDEARLVDGYYRIVGRRLVDMLNTGGYRISALEVEDLYRNHTAIRDVAVVGVPDPVWGERVCAAWVPVSSCSRPDQAELRSWGKERLAPYKVPHDFKAVSRLPRNAMGKVKKSQVASLFPTAGAPLPGARTGI